MFHFPPWAVRRMIREAKKSPRITVGELQRKVAFWTHQISKTTIRHHFHAKKLFGRHARKKPFLSIHFTRHPRRRVAAECRSTLGAHQQWRSRCHTCASFCALLASLLRVFKLCFSCLHWLNLMFSWILCLPVFGNTPLISGFSCSEFKSLVSVFFILCWVYFHFDSVKASVLLHCRVIVSLGSSTLSVPLQFHHKRISTWCLLNATGTLTGTMFYGQMKLKLSFSATNTQHFEEK